MNTGFRENRKSSDSFSESLPILNSESEVFGDRLRNIIGMESNRTFAKRCSISDGLLGAYIRGEKTPGMDKLVTIANAGGVSVDWLATGRGPKSPRESRTSVGPEPSGYIAIPLYDIRASAGHGAVNEPVSTAAADALMFKEDWIRFELGATPANLFLVRVSGDSMEPTLRAGDVILIDRSASRPDREGIYLMRMGEMLLVKRLQALPGGRIRVTSDNAAFEPWMLEADKQSEEVQIYGRVVWSGRRL
jgi:phage repressor protein C with HTH and peptisase S24 domain